MTNAPQCAFLVSTENHDLLPPNRARNGKNATFAFLVFSKNHEQKFI